MPMAKGCSPARLSVCTLRQAGKRHSIAPTRKGAHLFDVPHSAHPQRDLHQVASNKRHQPEAHAVDGVAAVTQRLQPHGVARRQQFTVQRVVLHSREPHVHPQVDGPVCSSALGSTTCTQVDRQHSLHACCILSTLPSQRVVHLALQHFATPPGRAGSSRPRSQPALALPRAGQPGRVRWPGACWRCRRWLPPLLPGLARPAAQQSRT